MDERENLIQESSIDTKALSSLAGDNGRGPLDDFRDEFIKDKLDAFFKVRTELILSIEPYRNHLNKIKQIHNIKCGEHEDIIEACEKRITKNKEELKNSNKKYKRDLAFLRKTEENGSSKIAEVVIAHDDLVFKLTSEIEKDTNIVLQNKKVLKSLYAIRKETFKKEEAIFKAEKTRLEKEIGPRVVQAKKELKLAERLADKEIAKIKKERKLEYLEKVSKLDKNSPTYKEDLIQIKVEYIRSVKNVNKYSSLTYFGLGVLNLLKTIGLFVVDLLWSVVKSLLNIFIYAYKAVLWIAKFIYSFFKKKICQFQEGDTTNKLSFIFMGIGSIKRGQPINGFLYLLAEIVFIFFMVFFGGTSLYKFTMLGDVPAVAGGLNPDTGMYEQGTAGDNSFLCLLYGVISIILVLLFIYLWSKSIDDANKNLRIVKGVEIEKGMKKVLEISKDPSSVYPLISTLVEEKGVTVRKYSPSNKIYNILRAEGYTKYEALFVSRINFKLREKDPKQYYSDVKFDYDKYHHEFDRFNDYDRVILYFDKTIEAYEKRNLIVDAIYARDEFSVKNGLTPLMEGSKVNPADAISRIAVVLNTEIPVAKSIFNHHIEKLDSEICKVKLEEIKLRKQAFIEESTNHYHGHPLSIGEQMKELMDSKFAITVLALPVALALVIVILPLAFTILVAFTQYDGKHQYPTLWTWVGFDNFAAIFLGQSSLPNGENLPYTIFTLLGWTIIWAISATFINYILGIVLALLINKKGIKLKKMWRTIFVITIAVPQFVSLLAVSKVFADEGVINTLITSMGGEMVPFFSDGTLAKVMCVVINIWVGIPYTMLVASGLLMNIPEDLYESARVDGAGPTTQFFKITLPYMLFVTGPYLVTQFVGNINNFNVIFFLTGGGPTNDIKLFKAGQTDLLITWLYKLATGDGNYYNIASTLGIFIFIVCAFFSLIMYSKLGSVQNEEEFQ